MNELDKSLYLNDPKEHNFVCFGIVPTQDRDQQSKAIPLYFNVQAQKTDCHIQCNC